MRIKLPSRPRAQIGDQFTYRDAPKGPILTITHESNEPGYLGYYAYLVKVLKEDNNITHRVIYGSDLFSPAGLYVKHEEKGKRK